MSFFAVHPTWHNYSSLVREASSAREALTAMERAHHMTAALYFGVAALEAFVNEEMRSHLAKSGITRNAPKAVVPWRYRPKARQTGTGRY